MPAARLNPSRRSKGNPLLLSLGFRKGETRVPSGTGKESVDTKNAIHWNLRTRVKVGRTIAGLEGLEDIHFSDYH